MPFWKGDQLGRPVELGRAIGARVRTLLRQTDEAALAALRDGGLDDWAAGNLMAYLREQREATRSLPDDRTVVVERFRDELGDWRLAVHCVLGARVNGPWALAIGPPAGRAVRGGRPGDALRRRHRGAACRTPPTSRPAPTWWSSSPTRSPSSWRSRSAPPPSSPPGSASAPPGRCCCPAATRAAANRSGSNGNAPRNCSTSPASTPTSRSPWRRPGSASRTSSTCPALAGLMRDLATRKVRLVEVETSAPSPFARSLLFGYVGAFLYEGDAPLAERRAAALALDSTLLGELLGRVDLRELLDPAVVTETDRQLRWLTDQRRPRDAEDVVELLRVLGDLCDAELTERGVPETWLDRAGGDPPGAAGPDRGRAALGRRRGRRPPARRARRGAADGGGRGVPRAGGRPAR